jgi:hypothetical protein
VPSIEMATQADLGNVLRLYLDGLAEIDLPYPIDQDACAQTVVDSYGQAPCFLLGDLGFAGLSLSRPGYSTQPILSDYMVYLKPEHRNFTNLKLLMGAVIDFSKSTGIPFFTNHKTSRDIQTHLRLADVLGFKVYGIIAGVTHG